MTTLPRESKYRHIFGEVLSSDSSYVDIKPDFYGEGQHIAVNSKYWAVPIHASGGGSFMVHPMSKTGRIPLKHPLVNYHTSHILDLAFNPFDENIIATSSDDCTVKILKVPEEISSNINKEDINLEGHAKKVTVLNWHPTASNVLASSGNDKSVIIWDAEVGEMAINIDDHKDLVYSIAWNGDGQYIATSSQDTILRVLDPRDEEGNVMTTQGHDNRKISRVFWVNNRNLLGSVGFTKKSNRELLFFDLRKMSEPYNTQTFDNQNSKFFPYFEEGNDILFLAGKGDLGIRAYELSNQMGFCHEVAELKSMSPQKGVGIMPRKNIETQKGEILRVFRLLSNSIEQMSISVPRRNAAMVFQEDLYPDCYAGKPAMTIDEYFDGANKPPVLKSMKNEGQTSESRGGSRFVRRNRKKDSKNEKPKKEEPKKEEPKKEEPEKEEPKKEEPKSEPVRSRAEKHALRKAKMQEEKEKRKVATKQQKEKESSNNAKEEIERLKKALEKSEKDKEKIQKELKKELEMKEREKEKIEKDLRKELEKVDKEKNKLKSDKAELEEEANNLKKKVEELQSGDGNKGNSEEIENLEKKVKKYARRARKLEKEVEKSDDIIDKQAETIKSLNKKISALE